MKKEFLTMALAATIVFTGILQTDAAPCKAGEPTGAQAAVKSQTCQAKGMKQPGAKLSKEEMKAKMEKRIEEFNKTLGLSDEQIAKAKEVRMQGHDKMKPLMEKKMAKKQELRTVLKDDSMNVRVQEKKIEALKKEIHEIDLDIRQLRRDNEKAFEAILTPEQKVKYAQIKEEGRKHFKEHKMPQGPENFGHKPPVGDHRYRPQPKKF